MAVLNSDIVRRVDPRGNSRPRDASGYRVGRGIDLPPRPLRHNMTVSASFHAFSPVQGRNLTPRALHTTRTLQCREPKPVYAMTSYPRGMHQPTWHCGNQFLTRQSSSRRRLPFRVHLAWAWTSRRTIVTARPAFVMHGLSLGQHKTATRHDA